jgi:hypothetical protein
MSAAGGGLGDVFVSRRMAAHEWTAWRVQLLESRVMAALVVEHPKHFRENPIVAVCEHIDHQLKAQRERFSPLRVPEVCAYRGSKFFIGIGHDFDSHNPLP